MVRPISRPQEMSGLRTINLPLPAASSGRATQVGGGDVPVHPTCRLSWRDWPCHSRPSFQDHTYKRRLPGGAGGGGRQPGHGY